MSRPLAGNGVYQKRRSNRRRAPGMFRAGAAILTAAILWAGPAVPVLAAEAGAGENAPPVIEYAALEELTKRSNPKVQAERASLDRWLDQYQDARDEIMDNRAKLREEARELKDDGDEEGSRHYLEQAKMLKESADQLDRQIRSLNSASNTMEIRRAEDMACMSAQDVMGAWHSLSLDRDSAAAKLEEASCKKEQMVRKLGQGMVSQADVDQAEQERIDAENRLAALDGERDQMKRELILLTGYSYDAAVEIGSLPAADADRAGALDLEGDKKKAWGNSYELRSQRHSGFSGTNKERRSRDRSVEVSEQGMYTRLTAIYGQVQSARLSCLASRAALAAAELDWKAAEHKQTLGMTDRETYLAAKTAYLESRALAGQAEISLLGALNRYDWAVKGLILQ